MKLNSKKYISVSRASGLSSYNPDYLTQMCRKGSLDCLQISKVWFISIDSLQSYLKHKNKSLISISDIQADLIDIEETLSGNFILKIGSEEYLNSDKAAELTSYNRDYLTQLARLKEVRAHKLGKVWFFSKDSLLEHLNNNLRLSQKEKSQSLLKDRKVVNKTKGFAVAGVNTTIKARNNDVKLIYESEHLDSNGNIPLLQNKIKKVPIKVKRDDTKQIHNFIKEEKNRLTEIELLRKRKREISNLFNKTRINDSESLDVVAENKSSEDLQSLEMSTAKDNEFKKNKKPSFLAPELRNARVYNTPKTNYIKEKKAPYSLGPTVFKRKRTFVNESITLDYSSQEVSPASRLTNGFIFPNFERSGTISGQMFPFTNQRFESIYVLLSYFFISLSIIFLLLLNLMFYGLIDIPTRVLTI